MPTCRSYAMSKTIGATTAYDFPVGARRKRKEAEQHPLGDFVKKLRLEIGRRKYTAETANLYTQTMFGDDLSDEGISQTHVSRIEEGERLPGPDLLLLLRRQVVKINQDPMGLVYAWLEEQGLDLFVEDIKRERTK